MTGRLGSFWTHLPKCLHLPLCVDRLPHSMVASRYSNVLCIDSRAPRMHILFQKAWPPPTLPIHLIMPQATFPPQWKKPSKKIPEAFIFYDPVSQVPGNATPYSLGQSSHKPTQIQGVGTWGGGPKNQEFIDKKCIFILTSLNFNRLQSTLHLIQYTYQDISSTAQNSFWTHWFWCLLGLLPFCFNSSHQQNISLWGLFYPGKQEKLLKLRSGE